MKIENETIDSIYNRRSIRSYSDKVLDKVTIEKLINAAVQAPSAVNKQTWDFVVITEQSIKDKISDEITYSKMVKDAPAAILVCGNLDKALPGLAQDFWIQDCSSATTNLLLAAHSLELGAVWTGIYPMQERIDFYKDLINLPENIIPFALIAVGYPEKEYPTKKYRLVDQIHYNKWD
jgi:nitroreductase